MALSLKAQCSPNRLTAVFAWMVVLGGAGALGVSGATVARHPHVYEWLILAAATVVSGSAALRMRSTNVSVSVSEVFVFSALIVFGPAAATVTVALDALVISIRIALGGKLSRAIFLFNIAAPSLAMFTAGTLLYRTGPPHSGSAHELWSLLAALAATAAAYFFLGTGAIAALTALQQRSPLINVWRRAMPGLWPSYAAGVYVAGLLAVYGPDLDWRVLASLLPLPVILYYAFRASIGRAEDQIQHLAETNRSYQRMIEALAHAVDAKDQVTHGHIRRVQDACQRLAHAVGVTDLDQLRAIEAGALLHDLGKIAVPEDILNKPGRLSPSEFERMKLHAGAGADILSEVQFPYPLVPIVRHHHENWDGSGYPAGLRGEEIPLGARILSVIDCYDALTSDRPYRRALEPEAAIAIIVNRRGTMYDPAVVDAFLRLHSQGAFEGPSAVQEAPRSNQTFTPSLAPM